MHTKREERAVSPVISVLLLLGITVGLVAVLSQIAFTTVDSSEGSTSADIEISHTEGNTNTVSASIRLIRNKNFESFSYIIEDRNGRQKSEGRLTNIDSPGDSQNIDLQVNDRLIILGEFEGNKKVIASYYIPD